MHYVFLRTSRKYSKKWEKDFSWLEYDENYQGTFCKVCWSDTTRTQTSQGSGGVWVTKPFQNWKKAVEKMRAHERSDNHNRILEAKSIANTGGTVVYHFQHTGDSDRT